MLANPFPHLTARTRKVLAIAGAGVVAIGGTAILIHSLVRRAHRPAIDGWMVGSGPGPDDLPSSDESGRAELWSAPHVIDDVINAPGWTTNVKYQPGDGPNPFNVTVDVPHTDPQWQPFRIDLSTLPSASTYYRADVIVIDEASIIARTVPITRKTTSARKHTIDVNEYTLQGPEAQTCYAERLIRSYQVDAGIVRQSPYLVRRPLPCTPAIPPQNYSLYHADRDVSLKFDLGEMRETFSKVRMHDAPYGTRKPIPVAGSYAPLFNLGMDMDDHAIYIHGAVAPTLSPMRLAVQITWQTRPA